MEQSSPVLSRKRNESISLSPEKSANAFLTQLRESRQAFDVFKEQADKKGLLGKKVPLLHSQAEYYSKYIKNRNVPNDYQSQAYAPPLNINRTSGDTLPDQHSSMFNGKIQSVRNRVAHSIDFPSGASSIRRKQPFVPLKDLLTRNHDDRVQEYLERMKGLSISEIINSSTLK